MLALYYEILRLLGIMSFFLLLLLLLFMFFLSELVRCTWDVHEFTSISVMEWSNWLSAVLQVFADLVIIS